MKKAWTASVAVSFFLVGFVALQGLTSNTKILSVLEGAFRTEETRHHVENKHKDKNDHEENDTTTTPTTAAAMSEAALYESIVAGEYEKDHFCLSWDYVMDDWWTHHPEWDVVNETSDRLCFQEFHDKNAALYRRLYNHQWGPRVNCSKVYTRYMWSSGWGADFENVQFGLLQSLHNGEPFAIRNLPQKNWWHYAAVKSDGSNATCPAKDMSCYFLPLGKCPPNSGRVDKDYVRLASSLHTHVRPTYHYVTRPQQWLRREVWDYVQPVLSVLQASPPCSVVHVRRTDVVLHSSQSRKYYAVADYVDMLPKERRQPHANGTIFLLTDDATAIDEAMEFFPQLPWYFLNRTRHRGREGGWENQTPSKSPKQEVVLILATLRLVKQCDYFVHGASKFSDAIYMSMREARPRVVRREVKAGAVFSASNSDSDTKLEERLERERQKMKQKESTEPAGRRRLSLSAVEEEEEEEDERLEAIQFAPQ